MKPGWCSDRHFRINASVEPLGVNRKNYPLSPDVDFEKGLGELGVNGHFDRNSVVVVQYDSLGNPIIYDKKMGGDKGYVIPSRLYHDNHTHFASEKIAWRIKDTNEIQYYSIYFDIIENGPREPIREFPAIGAGEPFICKRTNLSVGFNATPLVADWDGDGKKDLVVGSFSEGGYVYFFKNICSCYY